MKRKTLQLKYSYLLKLSEEDRQKLNLLQEKGINMSYEIRLFIRNKYNDHANEYKKI